MTCQHCHQRVATRPRGLCWVCYQSAAIRAAYVSTSKYAHVGVGNDPSSGQQLPEEPTMAAPGTAAKIEVLAARAAAGLALWHPQDATHETTPAASVAALSPTPEPSPQQWPEPSPVTREENPTVSNDSNVTPLLAWLDSAGSDVGPELDALIAQTSNRLKLLQALRRSVGATAPTAKRKPASSRPAQPQQGSDDSKIPVGEETLELLASILHDQGDLSVARLAELAGISDWSVRQALRHPWFERDDQHRGGKVRLTAACTLWPADSHGAVNGARH